MKISKCGMALFKAFLWLIALASLSICLFDIFTTSEIYAVYWTVYNKSIFEWKILLVINIILFLSIDYLRKTKSQRWRNFWVGAVINSCAFLGGFFILIIPLSFVLLAVGLKEDAANSPRIWPFILALYEIFVYFGGLKRMSNPKWVPEIFRDK